MSNIASLCLHTKMQLKNERMGIAHAEENAVRFYATMYFYYSVYDGADDKEKVKNEFASTIGSMAQEWIKQPKLTQIRKS